MSNMKSNRVSINGRNIGPMDPPYIICELSANHNGSLDRAFKMIDAAIDTGADAIKIQTYTPDTMTINSNNPDFRIKDGPWVGYTLYDLYTKAFTPFEWHESLFSYARARGATIFSTPFDETAVELLSALNSPAYKIASFEAVDLSLIGRVARLGKPIIISTGMASLGEIDDAVRTVREQGNRELALLHCTSAYPAPIDKANVRMIPHLAKTFGVVSGLSDHTPGSSAAVAAVSLGAAIIEKHFTLSRADGGLDSAFSLEPCEFRQLVQDCKLAWLSLGNVDYMRPDVEKDSLVFRRSLYVVSPILKGEKLTEHNVRSIRPGFGLAPKYLSAVLGRCASRDLSRGEALSWQDFV